MADAGITKMPETWDGLKEACVTLKEAASTRLARLDEPLAGPVLVRLHGVLHCRCRIPPKLTRARPSTGPKSSPPMETWKELTDLGPAAPNSTPTTGLRLPTWSPTAPAAMNLMGTFVTGYLNSIGLEPGVDYDASPSPPSTRMCRA